MAVLITPTIYPEFSEFFMKIYLIQEKILQIPHDVG